MGARRTAIGVVFLVAGCGGDTPKPTEVVAPIVPVTPAPGTSGYYCRLSGATTLCAPPCRSGDSLVFIVTRP